MSLREWNDERRRAAEVAAQACVRALKEQFGAHAAYIFGSLRGDSPWHDFSDVDIAVEGLPPERYFKVLAILSKLMPPGLELDLVTLEHASPELVALAKGEVTMPEEPVEALKLELENELKNMERIVKKADNSFRRIRRPPNEQRLIVFGKYVHDFYNGAEQSFERIEKRVGVPLPKGENWHTLLLEQVEREVPNRRPAVIEHALALQFHEYLKFRHRFRHIYGDELEWVKLRLLVEMMPQVFTDFKTSVERFLAVL